MNKFLTKMTAAVLALCSLLGMAACNEDGGHTCQASGAWSSDKTGHWHTCTVAGCTEKLDEAAHSFVHYGNTQCACGHFDTTKVNTAESLGIWYDTSDQKCKMYLRNGYQGEVAIIPEIYYDDSYSIERTITCIAAEDLFYENTYIKAVGLSESIYEIEENAFTNCTALETVYFPSANFLGSKTLAAVGDRAFAGCSSLKKLYFGDMNGSWGIGENAFNGCGFETLILPTNTYSIGDYAFEGCRQLQSITIPANIVSIGMYAFDNCPALTTVHFGGTKAKFRTFLGASNIDNLDDPADWLFLDKDARTHTISVVCSDGTLEL